MIRETVNLRSMRVGKRIVYTMLPPITWIVVTGDRGNCGVNIQSGRWYSLHLSPLQPAMLPLLLKSFQWSHWKQVGLVGKLSFQTKARITKSRIYSWNSCVLTPKPSGLSRFTKRLHAHNLPSRPPSYTLTKRILTENAPAPCSNADKSHDVHNAA